MTNALACFSLKRHYQFKLNVDIMKCKKRPLFQAFGKTIYEAEWMSEPGPPIVLVKIHGAKAAREAAFYAQLSCHPRIVRTYGLVENDGNSVLLVQERAMEGDLAERLRENEFRPSQAVLLEIFLQTIDAMMCLADNKIVHGDLACRNVLIYEFHDSNPSRNSVKLTDFGLTRTSTLFSVVSSTVSTTLTVIPKRYAAPELVHRSDRPIYSEKSDVYSMGVLMWEALSRGQLPYADIDDDNEVCRRKLRGEILDKPDHCDQALWTIITRCWQQRPDDRPTFQKLKETLLELKFQPLFPFSNIVQPNHSRTAPKSTWRDIIPVDSHFNPQELANKIRRIYVLSSFSSPELVLGYDDEEQIRQLCLRACEPAMLELLRRADAVAYLPTFIRNYVTTLNTLAKEIETLELPDNRRCKLRELLAVRHRLLEADWFEEATTNANDTEILDDICHSHQSIRSFQNLSYEQLVNRYLDRCNTAQRRTLKTLWIGEENLRLRVDQYHLSLIVIDWLNVQNITTTEMVTDSQVNDLIQRDLEQARTKYEQENDFQTKQNISDRHDQFKASVRNLYHHEVIGRPIQYKQKIKQQCDKITQALDELLSIDRTVATDKTLLRQQLTDIGTRLGVTWHFSREEMDRATELIDTIIQDLRFFRESIITLANNRYETDEEVVTCLNGSTALYGVQLIEPSRKMLRPLLSQPIYVSLESPAMTPSIKEFTFLNLQDSKKFIQAIETSGLTVAMKMQLHLIDSSSNVEADSATHHLSSKSISSLVDMRCHVIPLHSFHIGKDQMKLSEEAKTASNLVTDLTTARAFLSNFGSHISDGIQHVGGIFIHQISLETEEKVAVVTLKHAAARESNTSCAPGYRTHRSHLSSADQADRNSVLDEFENEQIVTVNHSVQSVGPACENVELFQAILAINKKSWFIIDRGTISSLIAVWEIIELLYPADHTMQEIAEFLKRAWLTDTSDCVPSEALLCEIDRVRLLQPTPILYLQNSSIKHTRVAANVPSLVDRLKNQLEEQIIAMNINYNTMTDGELLNKITSLIQTIIRSSHGSGFDLLSRIVCQAPVRDFLDNISNCHNDEKIHKVHAYLRTVFSEQRLRYFEKCNVKLEPSFIRFIGQTMSTSAKVDDRVLYLREIDEYAAAPTIPLAELPQHLTKSLSYHIALLIKKSLLGAEKNALSARDRSDLQAVRDVLVRFGWSMTREEFSSSLDENGIVALQKELKELLDDAASSSTSDFQMDSEEKTIMKQMKRVDASRKQTYAYKYYDWAIDRSLAPTDKPINRLIDILRHRLDMKLFSATANFAQPAPGNKAFTRSLLQKSSSPKPSPVDTPMATKANHINGTVYDALIQLVDTSDVLSQVELFRLLLERRSLVPLLTPTKSNPPFFYYATSLTFANVKLSTEDYCHLASDTALFRVAVISMRSIKESESREFLKQVFGCNSLVPSSIGCLSTNSCVAELGVGFCPKIDDDQSTSRYNEVLVLHTIGDYASIFPYIHDFADLFIVERHSDSSVQYQPPIAVQDSQRVIIWKSATVEREPYLSDEHYIHLESTIAQALNPIHDIIEELAHQADRPCRARIQDMNYPTMYDVGSINWISVEEDVKKQDYFKLRTAELQLQQLFTQEVEHLRSKIQNQTTFAQRETADRNIRECQRRRRHLASTMYNHSLLKCFVGVLAQNDEQIRTVGICQFVKHLEFYSKQALQQLSRNQEQAHAEFNSNSHSKEKRDAYYEAKRVYASSLVTIEHLWRELSHIYVSNTKRYAHLSVLAARHLLDGFSLELLDGDAGMLEQSWINAVFRELNILLTTNNNKEKSATRVLVLSVMGVQSSGKSTLLNLMFGTRLRASAGMCTRGVNIQLLKAEDRLEYDYVLILDTEGVRAPEFSGLQGATWRDNRMATFSILPADVTIIMINNEEDTAAREVLPIVMLAYQQSELAARSTNQLKTKLFFVYTRIDTNEKNKLSGIAQSLSLELRKAAADLEQSQRCSTSEVNNDDQTLASELLHDFRTEDIQFLGKLKVRDKPPEDVPEFDYGHDIVKLNGYISDRLTNSSPRWHARDLSNFADYLNAIWQCVQTVDFTLSFRTVLERWAYENLQAYCREMYGKLASLFSSEYDKLEPIILRTLDDRSLTSADCEKMIERFQTTFAAAVQGTVEELHQGFITHVNQQKYWQSWSVDTKRSWQIFMEKQTTDVAFRIRQLINNRLLFDLEFTKYQKALRDKISTSFQNKDENERKNIADDLARQSREFDDIFSAILHSVHRQHPVISVEDEVHKVYNSNGFGEDFDFTAQYRAFQSSTIVKPTGSDSNIIRSLWKKVTQLFSNSDAQKFKEETRFLLELQTYIDNLLKPVKRYIDHVPTEAIQITQRKLNEYKVKRDELKRNAHQVTYAQLIIQLSIIQSEWEKVHSIAVRLESARSTMCEYYKKTVQGIHGINLLKSELVSVFRRHLQDGFLALLQQYVITDLVHESWIGNDQIVQAMINLQLIALIREGKIGRVIRLLSNMGEHYSNIVEDLFRRKIHDLARDCCSGYYDLLRQAIEAAISETLDYRNSIDEHVDTNLHVTHQGRTDFFLHSLSHDLLEHRLARFSDDINALNVSSLSICDSEEDEVWIQVKDTIVESIPSALSDDYLLPENVNSLVKSIRDNLANRFARGGVTLRCSEPCPLCGSPCRAAVGHTMDTSEEKRRHDADHQPSGLFGTYQFETRELVPDSCSTNMGRNFTFAYTNAQDQRPYSEFSFCFPEWKQPPPLTTNANEVGQYVFYHYQNELAKYHKCRPCRKIPSSFDRSLDELEQKQESIINGITF